MLHTLLYGVWCKAAVRAVTPATTSHLPWSQSCHTAPHFSTLPSTRATLVTLLLPPATLLHSPRGTCVIQATAALPFHSDYYYSGSLVSQLVLPWSPFFIHVCYLSHGFQSCEGKYSVAYLCKIYNRPPVRGRGTSRYQHKTRVHKEEPRTESV